MDLHAGDMSEDDGVMTVTNQHPLPVIRSKTLVLSLDAQGRAVSLRHRESGYEFLSAQSHAVGLWQMGLMRPVTHADPLPAVRYPEAAYEGHEWFANRDEYRADLELDSDAAPAPEIRNDEHDAELNWSLPVAGGTAELTLSIAGGEQDFLEFRARVSLPEGWALKRLTFPRIRGLGDCDAPGEDALLYPESWGVLRRNPLEDMTGYSGQYPSHANWCQMAAWLHGEQGIYIGVRDPDASHTGIDLQYVEGAAPAPLETDHRYLNEDAAPTAAVPRVSLAQRLAGGAQPAFQLRCQHWPSMQGEWVCPYPVVLQGFSGGWHEAARIHRGWATKQRWCRRGRLSEREDASPALAETDLWFSKYGFAPQSLTPEPADAFQEAMHKLHDFFGMPFGVHWYNWHAFSWHRNFPGHKPAVEGFAKVVKELQGRGIVVMPYCQGRLLYRDRSDFENERTRAAVGAGGQPYLEMYTGQDDWPLVLCPSDDWARAQWLEAARMLWRDYGVEGVYFDQVSAMPPLLCYHAGHGHAPGGGDHWSRGYDGALAAMAPMIGEQPRRFLASELMADAYMDRIDLYLSFVPPLEEFVPLHPAIYGGYTSVMGRATPAAVLEDLQLFAICQGEQLLFGGQLGWMSDRILETPAAAEYLRDLARFRSHFRDFLHYGTLEAPLEVEQSARLKLTLSSELTMKPRPVQIDRPAVRHTVWRAPDGGLLVLLLNQGKTPAEVAVRLPDGPARTWGLSRLHAPGEIESVAPRDRSLAITLRGLEAVALVSPAAGQ